MNFSIFLLFYGIFCIMNRTVLFRCIFSELGLKDRRLKINSAWNRICRLSLFAIALGCSNLLQAQYAAGSLYKHWKLQGQEQERDLNDPTRSSGYFDNMPIDEAIRLKKKEMLGLVELNFGRDGNCEISEYGRKRREKFQWERDGEILLIGKRRYRVLQLQDDHLVMEDFGNTLINLKYRYIPAIAFDLMSEDELLTFTHYDSLVLRRATERKTLRERKELHNRFDATPKYIDDWNAFEDFLEAHFGERYIRWHQPYQGPVETTKLSFVVEKDSTVSLIGTEVSSARIYEDFQHLIRQTNGQWIPASYNFLPAPGLLEFVIKLKVLPPDRF